MTKDNKKYSLDGKVRLLNTLTYWISVKRVREQDSNMRDVYEAIYDELQEISERGHYSDYEKDYLNSLRSLYLDTRDNLYKFNGVNYNN